MRNFFLSFFQCAVGIALFICLGLPLFLLIGIGATVILWPVCLAIKAVESCVNLCGIATKGWTQEFEEFIFVCYGVAAVFLIFPLETLDLID